MFKKILIANRGEIACRVIRTARRLGISTVAVYSDADRDGLHKEMADEAVHIGASPSAESYLLGERIIQACLDTGADAVHPGYGFLSENASFAEALAKAGITFIGPDPHAITVMGDKITSKKLAAEASVNTIPGHPEIIPDADEAVTVARGIGYPVMLKASAGGGGKGMRIAYDDDSCRQGFELATNEARSGFGDDRIFIEKFIEDPRHIEIQIIADRHGSVVYLGERECSIQRRHQKVIEEAPSSFLDQQTREAMGEQACRLAEAVGYVSAGTVEFVVDGKRNFYFLEMNTRLQVEHPVTEYVTGLDLVELMLKVAANEPLPLKQDEIEVNGWAIESRIYAEDPAHNFLPSVGRLTAFDPPKENESVRVDTGVYEGSEVSIYYDPMIAKLITHGADRNQAIGKMVDALDRFYIQGVGNNIRFLQAVLLHQRFKTGDISTHMVEDEFPDGYNPVSHPYSCPERLMAIMVVVHRVYICRAAKISGQMPGHAKVVDDQAVIVTEDRHIPVKASPVEGGHDVIIDEKRWRVESDWTIRDALFSGVVNDKPVTVEIEREGLLFRLTCQGSCFEGAVLSPLGAELSRHMLQKVPPDLSKYLLSPMPGLLVKVAVEPGQKVKEGEELAVVEAMKMENVLRAVQDGVVSLIHAEVGASLVVDQPIIEFESD